MRYRSTVALLVVFGLGATLGAAGLFFGRDAKAAPPTVAEPVLEGFTIHQARFDESGGEKRPTPHIPKTWKLVGVSNGEKLNSNNLWFQDVAGTIYRVEGFNTVGKFIFRSEIYRLD